MIRRIHRRVAPLVLVLIALQPAQGDPRSPPSRAEPEEVGHADALFKQGDYLDALPLYDALSSREPKDPAYAERLAYCLMVEFENLPEGAERTTALARAKREAERAKSLGDASNLLQALLERLAQPAGTKASKPPAFNAAEAAFAKGDLEAALSGYRQAAAEDPTLYEARLFAGDVYFRMHDAKSAVEWFEKAVAVDPDREEAYRYWGDTLMQTGDRAAALERFIDAIVAEPYERKPWMGLTQWAQRTGATLKHLSIHVPPAPSVQENGASKPQVTIDLGPEALKNPESARDWLVYSATRALWREKTFSQHFPKETEYRHSLPEEVEALQAVLLLVGDTPETKLDPDLRTLVRLGKDGMLEPYVLLDAADSGIAQDYSAYRAEHRDRLHTYIERYIVRPKGSAD